MVQRCRESLEPGVSLWMLMSQQAGARTGGDGECCSEGQWHRRVWREWSDHSRTSLGVSTAPPLLPCPSRAQPLVHMLDSAGVPVSRPEGWVGTWVS
jgi:hypothetical protein